MEQKNIDFFWEEVAGIPKVKELCDILQSIPINWVGNKKRMLNKLMSFIERNVGSYDSFFDAFAGSGVVSMAATASSKRVVSNDALMLSTVWIKNILSGIPQPLSPEEVLFLTKFADSKDGDGGVGFIANLYNGSVLSKDEVSFINAYRKGVQVLFGNTMSIGKRNNNGVLSAAYLELDTGNVVFDKGLGNPEKASYAMNVMCVHILQQAFMGGRCYKSQLLAISEKRMQDEGRSSIIDNSLRLLKHLNQRENPVIKLSSFISRTLRPVDVLNMDAELALQMYPPTDVLYIDPPYGGYNSDYAWMYRVCEEFLTGRLLEESEELREITVKFKGEDFERDKAFRAKPRKSYQENFAALLKSSVNFPSWIISFNESSFSSINDIIDIVSSFRPNILVESIDGYRYNYRDNDKKTGSEYMIFAK